MAQEAGQTGYGGGVPADPGPPPPQFLKGAGLLQTPNPAYAQWQAAEAAYQQALQRQNLGVNPDQVPGSTSGSGKGGPAPYAKINGQYYQYNPKTGKYDIPYNPSGPATAPKVAPTTVTNLGGGGGGGAMTAYEQAQVALDKQRLADAEAAQKATQQHDESVALQSANKDFQDYQSSHYYGAINGMAYAPPAGASTFFKLPQPSELQAAYGDKAVNTTGIANPWNQGPSFSGYTGTNFFNMQQPGQTQNTIMSQGATPAPAPGQKPPAPIPQGMAGGGKVPGPPGQPQLELLHGGESVVPGDNFDPSTPVPPQVANQGPEGMNPIIQQLLQAVNGLITSPEFRSIVYSKGSSAPMPDSNGAPDAGSMASMPPGAARGTNVNGPTLAVLHGGEDVVPTPSMPPIPIPSPSSPNPWQQNAPPMPPGMAIGGSISPPISQVAPVTSPIPSQYFQPTQSPVLGTPTLGSTPFQQPTQSPILGAGGIGAVGTIQGFSKPLGTNYRGSNPLNASTSDVVSGPLGVNHVPYGPELTGLSGYGGLITPNGTPVPMSMWQRAQLDPTSIARYNDYAGSIAGIDPKDLEQIGTLETGNKMQSLTAPKKFTTAALPVGSSG